MRLAAFVTASLCSALLAPGSTALAQSAPDVLVGRIIAIGIPGAGAISAVGVFHAGGPIHDNAAFAATTTPGRVLDPQRILVASSSNFGSPAMPGMPEGSVLSIDPRGAPVRVPPAFAATGGQAVALEGRVQLFTAAGKGFTNGVNTPAAVTADLPAVSKPLGISINNAFGRLWFPSAPRDGAGPGFESIIDPSGIPLANAPHKTAGGVFTEAKTNRVGQLIAGEIKNALVANAFLGESPDGSHRAVFAVLAADGSLTQIHTEQGLDGLAPAGTVTPQSGSVARAGLLLNWVPDRVLYATDAARNALVVLPVGDNGKAFTIGTPRRITGAALVAPFDLAPAVPETVNGLFSSNTTLAGGSDLYVLNANGTIARIRQNGTVVAVRRVSVPGTGVFGPGQLAGIATAPDAAHLWVTVRTALTGEPPGAVIELPAFGAAAASVSPTSPALRSAGEIAFRRTFKPANGLGPLFNERSCVACHFAPTVGGTGKDGLAVVLRVAHVDARFDPLLERGGPVSRAHSVSELGFACPLTAGIPATANVTSVRNTPALYNAAAIEAADDAAIAAGAVVYADGVHGRPNRVDDGDGVVRNGRFGWKADVARLETFVALAFRNELGITNPLFPRDLVATRAPQQPCAGEGARVEDDGSLVRAVTAFIRSLEAPPAQRRLEANGAAVFTAIGCAECHSSRLRAGAEPLYSDLLLHDMGPGLDDGITQGQASGRDWRTTPLLGSGLRKRFLHDGRALTIAEAVRAHDGEASAAIVKYRALDEPSRRALVAFVGSL